MNYKYLGSPTGTGQLPQQKYNNTNLLDLDPDSQENLIQVIQLYYLLKVNQGTANN